MVETTYAQVQELPPGGFPAYKQRGTRAAGRLVGLQPNFSASGEPGTRHLNPAPISWEWMTLFRQRDYFNRRPKRAFRGNYEPKVPMERTEGYI